MNSFGLGLVLNFVDHASAGMNTATSNFNRMSATADNLTSSVSASATEIAAIAFSLGAVGDTFTSIGESIMGVFTGISNKVISVGGQMFSFRLQLGKLYGDSSKAGEKINEAMKFATSSNFNVEDLIPAITKMKTVGIEALDEVTTSSGQYTQRLLDYAADFASMVGDEYRNIYGTGINAMMGAIKEYIAEGNARTLKSAGWNITERLGEEKGATIEERTRQVADLAEQLGFVGYAAELAGTPMQRLSNMQDVLYNIMIRTAESGVYDKYCELLEKLSDWVFALYGDEELLNTITSVLADTVDTILSPLESMLDWVVKNSDAIINWIKENPKLVKNILLTVAAVGAFLVVGGSLLKLLSSIAFAMSGLNMLKSLPLLFGKIVLAVLPFVALAGLAYTAWDKNLGGIKDKVVWFVNNIGDIFTILGDAWGDNTLSEENFLRAKELGILPFISGILQLKYYWDYFVEGFKSGFTFFFEGLVKALGSLGIDIDSLAERLFDFLDRLTQPGAEEEWTKLGEALGTIIAGLATLALLVKVLEPVFKVLAFIGKALKFIWDVLRKIAPVVSVVVSFFRDLGAAISLMREGYGFFQVLGAWFPKIAGALSAVGKAIMGVLSSIASAAGISVGWVVAIIVAVIAVITLIIVFRKQIGQFFVWLWGVISNAISNAFNAVVGFFSKLAQAFVNSPFGKAVIGVIRVIVAFIGGIVKVIASIIGGIAKVIWAIIKGVAGFIVAVVQGIWNVIKAVANFIWTLIKTVASLIMKIVNVVYQFFRIIFLAIYAVVKTVITAIVDFFKWLWSKAQPYVQAIGDFFAKIFNWISEKASIVSDWISEAFTKAADWIKEAFNSVADFFTNIWDKITDGATAFFDWITDKLSWLTDSIAKIGEFFGGGLDSAGNWLKGIGDKLEEFVGLSTGGYVKTTGLAVLHPNEVVVNDETTRRLQSFLSNYESVPADAYRNRGAVSTYTPNTSVQSIPAPVEKAGDTHNDYSVTFASGSIVIQLLNANDSELEKAAEKIMKIIARKQQLRAMAVRG